jgi:hypothetical protein
MTRTKHRSTGRRYTCKSSSKSHLQKKKNVRRRGKSIKRISDTALKNTRSKQNKSKRRGKSTKVMRRSGNRSNIKRRGMRGGAEPGGLVAAANEGEGEPGEPERWLRHGISLYTEDPPRLQEARASFVKVLRLDPRYTLAAEYRKTIDIDLLNADENRTIHELLLTMSQTPLSGHETVFNIASKIREDYNDMRSKITKESTP